MSPEVSHHTDDIHHRIARRADAVLCDSPWERGVVQAQTHGRNNCHYVSNGVNVNDYRPGRSTGSRSLLFVGDLAEPRKRFDRLAPCPAPVPMARPEAGRDRQRQRRCSSGSRPGSDSLRTPGYVSESELPGLRRGPARLPALGFRGLRHPDPRGADLGDARLPDRPGGNPEPLRDLPGGPLLPGDDPEATFASSRRRWTGARPRSARPRHRDRLPPPSTGTAWPSGSGKSGRRLVHPPLPRTTGRSRGPVARAAGRSKAASG